MMDLGLKLREARRLRGLKQHEVAAASGVGVKSLNSFETGKRVGSIKVAQLAKIIGALGFTMSEFFSAEFDARLAEGRDDQAEVHEIVTDLLSFDEFTRTKLVRMFRLAIELERQTAQRRRVV